LEKASGDYILPHPFMAYQLMVTAVLVYLYNTILFKGIITANICVAVTVSSSISLTDNFAV